MRHAREPPVSRRLLRRGVGMVQIAVWAAILLVADRPFRELGGLLGERMRWLERLVLGSAWVAGCLAGAAARDAAGDGGAGPRAWPWRRLWLVPSALVLGALIGLELSGDWGAVLLVFAGWLAYGAGLDVSRRVWPLARRGRDGEDDAPRA